jgi:hypothetical protein
VHMPHHFLTTWMESWAFIKSSAQTYTIHMKLSLRLSFQPRHSLGDYTVGTIAGFRVPFKEALAP